MRYKIVSDSSSNLQTLEGVDYASVPLKVVTAEKEYVDDAQLDIGRMQQELRAYKGRSGTACPSVGEWLDSFGQAEGVFAVTITSSLSGAYNACVQAKAEYEETEGRRVCCLDSLSTGPEMALIIEKLRELIAAGKLNPALIVGVPVGFVNVVESKELILELNTPHIVARGRKGGSNVAAAICNAMLYQIMR